jgi:hypothetical protein
MEARLDVQDNACTAFLGWVARTVEEERSKLSPEARAELEGLEAAISDMEQLACERADVKPPASLSLGLILEYADATQRACKEHLADDEKQRLTLALARRAAITGHGDEDEHAMPHPNTAAGLVRTQPWSMVVQSPLNQARLAVRGQ